MLHGTTKLNTGRSFTLILQLHVSSLLPGSKEDK